MDACEPPLHYIREQRSLNLYYRILSHPNHPLHYYLTNQDHDRLFANRPSCVPSFGIRMRLLTRSYNFTNIKIHVRPLYNILPWQQPNINILRPFTGFDKANTDDTIFRQLFASHREEYHNYVAVYTDGSKTSRITGCGFFCQNYKFSYCLPGTDSIFTAEIIAIKEALSYIKNKKHKKYIIYTDSKSALDALMSHNPPNSLVSVVQDIYSERSKQGYDILFCWVPGHVGIYGNELADMAAKEALVSLCHDVSLSDIKIVIKMLYLQKWQEHWNSQTCNKLRNIKATVCLWPTINHRHTDVLITRLRIGHTRLTHKHLLCGDDGPVCSLCSCPLTVHHIFTSCIAFTHLYIIFFGCISPILKDILGESPHHAVLPFLKAIGFYHQI